MSKQTFVTVFAIDDKEGKQQEWTIMSSSAGQAVVDAHELFPEAQILKVFRKDDW